MATDAISVVHKIAIMIQEQTQKMDENNTRFRQLGRQSVAISNDIRENYASLDNEGTTLPKNMIDIISELQLVLEKILKAVEKEQRRNKLKSWLMASSRATLCSSLGEELASCAARFGFTANMHILGQTRLITMKQDQVAIRDEELFRTIITGEVSAGRVQAVPVSKYDTSESLGLRSQLFSPAETEYQGQKDHSILFQEFLTCVEPDLLRSLEISSSFQEAFAFFFYHVESRHSGLNVCYAATETFVIEYEGDAKVLGCVAVLKEKYDLQPNFDDRAGNIARCRNDFIFDFRLLDVIDRRSSPSDWIQVQSLAENFSQERVSFALWDLGRLPPASHLPDSDSFRWIKQSLATIPTKFGLRTVVDVESGNNTHPFRRFHQLNARIAHPANAVYRLDLIKHIKQDMRTICEESNEEWFITLVGQVPLIPGKGRARYLKAHQRYAYRSIEIEIEAFQKMKISAPLSVGDDKMGGITFEQIQKNAFLAIEELFQSLEEFVSATAIKSKAPLLAITTNHLKLARYVGEAWWWIHTSIVLLTSEGREQSSNITRKPLAKARHDLAQMTQPHPTLIWNYLPPHLAARARQRRLNLLKHDAQVGLEIVSQVS